MFESLAIPGNIGHLELKNRFILSPLHTMLADRNGQVTPEMLAYYRERALGGAALLVSEYAFIDQVASQANFAQLGVYDDACVSGLARLAEAIHHAGALAGLQIAHAGRQRFLGVRPIVAPSRVPWEELHQAGAPVPDELTVEQIGEIVDSFGQAARRAQLAGFDLVELHAGHGYLPGQFLSPHTNRRGDLYGGSLESRQRFLHEVVTNMRGAVGIDYPITVRLSGSEYLPDGIQLEDTVQTAAMLQEQGVAAIDISAGNHHRAEIQVQPMYFRPAFNADAAKVVKQRVRIPVSVVGSITSAEVAEDIVRAGAADFVRLGRPLLSDPHFAKKAIEGKTRDIRPCIRCNDCLDRGLLLKRSVVCSVNFTCGREDTYKPEEILAADEPLSVAIVGGGPAGLEATRVASLRGHQVTLYEGKQLGGALVEASVPDFKKDLARLLDYLIQQIPDRVEVKELTATPEILSEQPPAVLILASGAIPVPPQIPGITSDRILDSRSVLAGTSTGPEVIVHGGNQFSAEVAVFLARQGKKVCIIHSASLLASDVGPHTRRPLLSYLKNENVQVITESRLVAGDDHVCIVETGEGSQIEVPFDTIVSGAYEANHQLFEAFSGGSWRLRRIGDSVRPRRIFDAIHEAHLAARTI